MSSGVTRNGSRGQAVATISGISSCADPVRRSPDGATAWSATVSCELAQPGPGRQASGVATTSFTESYAGGDLVAVTASSSNSAAGLNVGACGSGDYQLSFSVARTTAVSIDAQLTGGRAGDIGGFIFFGPDGVLIDDRDGGSVNQTVTLTPGGYAVIVQAGTCVGTGNTGSAGSASFSLTLTFGS